MTGIRTHAAGLSKEGPSRMTDRYWKDRDRFDRATVADRDISPRAGEDVRNYNSDRPYPDRDYSGISYGHTGGHAEDRSVHRSSAGLESGYMEYGRQSYGGPYGAERHGAREWSSTERWRVPGPHTGRGPRGYQRSDERILEELNDRLTAHGLIDASDIDTRVKDCEITLEGWVDSREAKRAAGDVAEEIPGVRDVHNHLRLRSHVKGQGVGRTSVLGLTESQIQRHSKLAPISSASVRRRSSAGGGSRRSRTRT
jgi:hypothetical protein